MPTGYPGRTHGLIGTYISGCRCDQCQDARRAYYNHRPMDQYLAEVKKGHGSIAEYRHRGCRCEECRAASAEQRRKYRANPEARERENARRRESRRRARSAA